MIELISPEYNFAEFCRQMFGKDPVAVMDAASAELTYARRLHQEATKDRNFRKGSKGRAYCEDLQRLVSLCMGSVPSDATADYLMSVKPLMMNLLQRWEIGDLRRVFANVRRPDPAGDLLDSVDFLSIVVSKREIDSVDISAPLSLLKRLVGSPAMANRFFERVDIAFHGYDHVPQELFEIPEVRDFVLRIDKEFPFWLFFLSKQHLGLQCLLFCLLPPHLTEEGRSRIFPERIEDLLTRRWFPAMNHICEYAGFSRRQIDQLTDRVLAYITRGKLEPKLD